MGKGVVDFVASVRDGGALAPTIRLRRTTGSWGGNPCAVARFGAADEGVHRRTRGRVRSRLESGAFALNNARQRMAAKILENISCTAVSLC